MLVYDKKHTFKEAELKKDSSGGSHSLHKPRKNKKK
jgi:hypothetical protein